MYVHTYLVYTYMYDIRHTSIKHGWMLRESDKYLVEKIGRKLLACTVVYKIKWLFRLSCGNIHCFVRPVSLFFLLFVVVVVVVVVSSRFFFPVQARGT